jgi:steroid delta-isomerase-like uncharacterized protein
MIMAMNNKELTRRWFEEVWNKRRVAAIEELSDPSAVVFGLADGGKPMGFDQFLPFYTRFTETFPDIRIIVDEVLEDGDKTVARLHAVGTHTGGAMGVPPTGNRINITGIIITRWKDGKIIEAWNEFDAWGMMQQISGPAPMKVKQ